MMTDARARTEDRCFRCKKALAAGDARSLSERLYAALGYFFGTLRLQPIEPYCARCARSLDRGLLLLASVFGFGAIAIGLLAVSHLVEVLF